MKEDGTNEERRALLAALRILVRSTICASSLRTELCEEFSEDAATAVVGDLEERGVFAVKLSAARVAASLQAKGNSVIR